MVCGHCPLYWLNVEVKVNLESNKLVDLIKSTRANEVGYLGRNAATVLVSLNPFALKM
jgi:hypothetical protein